MSSLYTAITIGDEDEMASSINNDSRVFKTDVETVEEFIERFKLQNRQALHKARNDSLTRASLLANSLPVEILANIQRRLKPIPISDATYEDIEENLIAAYGVKKSIIGAAVAFLSRRQKSQETIEDYSKCLNELSSQCNYSECCRGRLLRDVFIQGLSSPKLMRALITDCEESSFQQVIARAKTLEQITRDVADMNPTEKVHSHFKLDRPGPNQRQRQHGGEARARIVPTDYVCIRCGKSNHFADQCYARDKKCIKCNKKGHLSTVCRSKTSWSNSNQVADEEDDAIVNQMRIIKPGSRVFGRSSGAQSADRFHSLRECVRNSDDRVGNGYSSSVNHKHGVHTVSNCSTSGDSDSPFLE